MSDLPSGWEWSNVGNVADVVGGVQKSPRRRPVENAYPMLRVANVLADHLDLREVSEIELFDGELDRLRLQPGDCLVVEGNGSVSQLGRAAMWRGEVADCVHQNHIIRARPRINPTFLTYWILSPLARREIERIASSTSGLHVLSGRKLRDVRVPVPPMVEQDQIVTAIEERLSRLEAADSAIESAGRRLVQLHQALVEQAVAGDWEARSLGSVLVSVKNGCFVSRPAVEPPGLPIYRISAVRPLVLDVDDVRYAPDDLDNAADFQVDTGDLLFTRYSGNRDYVGACAIVPKGGAGRLHPDKLIRAVPATDVVLGGWIALAVTAAAGRSEIERRLKTTAGQVGIAGGQLKTVPIPVPPLSVQRERVDRWSEGMAAASRLTASMGTDISGRSKALRQAVLAAAFSGRLVEQDPTDEPASVLLDRIRAEHPAKRLKTKATS